MIRKIKGKSANQIKSHLRLQNDLITNKEDITTVWGTGFPVSSNENDLDIFKNHKIVKESQPLNFENYNAIFMQRELKVALDKANPPAPGHDNIHYQFLSHHPNSCQKLLLTFSTLSGQSCVSEASQGSVLSFTAFNIILNNIVIPFATNANVSLFVDDFAIYIEGKYLRHLE